MFSPLIWSFWNHCFQKKNIVSLASSNGEKIPFLRLESSGNVVVLCKFYQTQGTVSLMSDRWKKYRSEPNISSEDHKTSAIGQWTCHLFWTIFQIKSYRLHYRKSVPYSVHSFCVWIVAHFRSSDPADERAFTHGFYRTWSAAYILWYMWGRLTITSLSNSHHSQRSQGWCFIIDKRNMYMCSKLYSWFI